MNRVYDSWNRAYKSVFGALRQNEPCTFTICISKSTHLDTNPMMILYRPGMKERFIPMNTVYDSGDYIYYSATCSAKFPGVHYYYFSYISSGQWFYIKKKDAHNGIVGEGGLFQLTVFDDMYETPAFLKGGVMYQIFPDRFCKSGKHHENVPSDRVLRDDWGGTPYYRPDENGHVWNNDYFGGDIDGIIEKLPYLESLGVTCIYLNPIFESHENHRYNTANYRNVDPLLGTNDDFARLCRIASRHGIRVILDGVFSHTGADSIYFNKFRRYDTVGAYQSKNSPYYKWYSFHHHPDTYEAWWGIDTLPNVNENEQEYTDYICGRGGVLEYWMQQGAAGFRLDVADELPDAFLDHLHDCVKRADGDHIVIGEVWEDASTKEAYGVKRRYLLGNQLDSVMNYPFRTAIMQYLGGCAPKSFRDQIMCILENYPKCSVDVLMNFVSTHDIDRAITVFGGEPVNGRSKDWMAERRLSPEQYAVGKNKLKCAMVLQFFLPGVPSIYYGDEAGLDGYGDPFNRRCYPWGNEDQDLIAFTKELSRIRHASDVFVDGMLKFLVLKDDYIIFARYQEETQKAVVIALNRSDHDVCVEVQNVPFMDVYSTFSAVHGEIRDGKTILPPYGFTAVKVDL
ncbi:MAG: glycoside hydrolase family 13 protein [Oscillospiraceae bacterium]|nr:glycoside hydrolase family 13 protein [Oscillospiraceae bacterium]